MAHVTSTPVSRVKASHMAISNLKWVRKCHLTVCPEGERKGIFGNAPEDYLTGIARPAG